MAFGISNSQKRGITKTYSRKTAAKNDRAALRVIHRMDSCGNLETETIGQEAKDIESLPPASLDVRDDTIVVARLATPSKSRAIDSITSSPLSEASNPFSDDEDAASSIPSSPPPGRRHSSVENHASRKPAFGFMSRKRKADEEPFSELSNNAVSKKVSYKHKKQKLVQTKLDLGGQPNKTCKDCGMEYVPSVAEDSALHKAFHFQNIGGVDLGKGFVESITGTFDAGTPTIIAIDHTAALNVRRKARKVLDVVRTDLGALDVDDEYLWGVKDDKKAKSKTTKEVEFSTNDRPKIFLYCINDKCIGLCLVERITVAAKVVSPSASSSPSKTITQEIAIDSTSIFTSPSSAPMLLGISRIWVSKARRGNGIATRLLDHARAKYFYGIEIPKSMIAFSQPTASGRGLAEKWFGVGTGEALKKPKKNKGGWHVYAEGA